MDVCPEYPGAVTPSSGQQAPGSAALRQPQQTACTFAVHCNSRGRVNAVERRTAVGTTRRGGVTHCHRVGCISSRTKVIAWSCPGAAVAAVACGGQVASHTDGIDDDDSFEQAWAALRVEHGLEPESPPRKRRHVAERSRDPCHHLHPSQQEQPQQQQEQQYWWTRVQQGNNSTAAGTTATRPWQASVGELGCSSTNAGVDRGVGRGLSVLCDVALFETPSFALRRLPSFALGPGGTAGQTAAQPGHGVAESGGGGGAKPQQLPPSSADVATMFADIVDETLGSPPRPRACAPDGATSRRPDRLRVAAGLAGSDPGTF